MRRAEERAERTAAMETEAAMQAAADWVRDNDHVDLAELDTEIARLQVCASLQTGQYRVGNTPLTRLDSIVSGTRLSPDCSSLTVRSTTRRGRVGAAGEKRAGALEAQHSNSVGVSTALSTGPKSPTGVLGAGGARAGRRRGAARGVGRAQRGAAVAGGAPGGGGGARTGHVAPRTGWPPRSGSGPGDR